MPIQRTECPPLGPESSNVSSVLLAIWGEEPASTGRYEQQTTAVNVQCTNWHGRITFAATVIVRFRRVNTQVRTRGKCS